MTPYCRTSQQRTCWTAGCSVLGRGSTAGSRPCIHARLPELPAALRSLLRTTGAGADREGECAAELADWAAGQGRGTRA